MVSPITATQTTLNYSSLSPPLTPLIATRISEYLTDISTRTSAHHLKLNLNKTELLFLLGKDCPHMDLLVTVEDAVVGPSPTVRNLGVILDNQLRCTANITVVTQSCRFALYNIRRIRPFLAMEAAQLLVQALVVSLPRLLQLAPGWTPCLRDQAFAAHPERASTTRVQPAEVLPRDPSLLTSTPCSSSQQFQDDGTDLQGCQWNHPTYLQALVRPHAPARALRATTSAGWLVPPSLRAGKSRTAKSQLFSVLAPLWWNDLPADVRTAESITCFRKRLKTHLFRIHPSSTLPTIKKKKSSTFVCPGTYIDILYLVFSHLYLLYTSNEPLAIGSN